MSPSRTTVGALVLLLSACTSSATPTRTSAPPTPTSSPAQTTSSSARPTSSPPVVVSSSRRPSPTPSKVRPTSSSPAAVAAGAPVIVLDPGHSPSIRSTDPATGLVDSDYENEPEMRDVFAVAELTRARLQADGYRVVMTKNSVTDRVSLGARAAVANQAHAALALSIHDQAGANGGIPFATGNNVVYYQSVGGYRVTPGGTHVTFTNSAVATTSMRYGEIFQTEREQAEGHSVRLQANVGYDLGSRGLAAGDMWMVQLLSTVPWIYNEAGGNSAGQSGLSASDERRYADGLVTSIERCVPIRR